MENNKYKNRHRQKYITFLVGMVVVVISLIVLFYFVIGVSKVDGESMLPTLNNNETLVFYRLDKKYNHGDIIAVDMPNGDYYVKRVIGIEGDEVDIRNGKVFLNGQELSEPYIQGVTNKIGSIVSFPQTVQPGKVFVLGDNREHSTDSRVIGQVSHYAILGKILGQ